MRPRCGRAMHPYEAVWGALLDDVTCGRPEGHNGQCRSRQAIRKERERSRQKWPEYGSPRQQRRRQAQKQMRLQLPGAVKALTAPGR